MDDDNGRRQRNSLSYPYLGQFTDTLTLNSQSLDVDMGMPWKSFEFQSPQCVGPDNNTFDCFRTSHDDLCAYPPKCPTSSLLGSAGNASSHMLFHTRHYPQQADLHHPHQHQHHLSTSSLSFDTFGSPAVSASSPGLFHSTTSGHAAFTPFGSAAATASPATPTHYNCFDHDDFADQLSALSSPHHVVQDMDGDKQSTCDSDCGDGEICHDSACSDNPSGCCEDETCLQSSDATDAIQVPLTPEDAIAAAALTSFVDQNAQPQQTRPTQGHQKRRRREKHQERQRSLAGTPALHGHNPVIGPDLCISPQFLTNYQHLREAHNPLNPTSCTASFCPIEDPNFYTECHMKHLTPQGQAGDGFFDNFDLNLILPTESSSLSVAYECGAKFPNGEAMVQHLWNEHRTSLSQLPSQPLQPSGYSMHSHVPGLASSASSTVSLSSQDMHTPSTVTSLEPASLTLRDDSSPCRFDSGGLFGQLLDSKQKPLESEQRLSGQVDLAGEPQTGQRYECLWCNTVGGTPCGKAFDSASELHKHAIDAHTHLLKRDVGGTYSCGWQGCNRRDGEEKGGFAQKSKIDRHMQVHTGNKPFLCDTCGQSFSANQALVQHKLIHADIKPLACEICGKTFRQHSALTMHIRTHTKVRPLKCPYCNKEFSESSNLSKHKRIHTGEGLYVCNFHGCGKHFHRKDQLRRHSAQHTKNNSGASSATTAAVALTETTEGQGQ